jgi:MFS family permease
MTPTAVARLALAPAPANVEADPGRRTLPASAALYLLASIVVSLLAGSSAPTPLYAIYQGQWGFSPITTTIIFGIYAIAVLSSLLVFGRLSDHVGRRPVLLVALAVQMVTMVLFATADGVPALVTARVVQGLSTGAAIAAIGPACSTSTGSRARSRTRSFRCSASVPAACCPACSCSSSRGRPTWSTWC